MDKVNTLIFRGLENDTNIIVYFNDTREKFDIKCLFDTFGGSSSDRGETIEYSEWVLMYGYENDDDTEESSTRELATLAYFLRALEFCSDIAADHIVEISFVLYLFQQKYVNVQWVEKELYEIVTNGRKPAMPQSETILALQDEIAELNRCVQMQRLKIRVLKSKYFALLSSSTVATPVKKRSRADRSDDDEEESE